MAPTTASAKLKEGWVLLLITHLLLAVLLVCPVTSFKRLQVDQSDEDLTFDDENPHLLSRSRREAIVFDEHGSGTGTDNDDEDFGSGSGDYPDYNYNNEALNRFYRINFISKTPFTAELNDKTSAAYASWKSELEDKFKTEALGDIEGEIFIHVLGVQIGPNNSQKITMDVTHQGETIRDFQIQSQLNQYINFDWGEGVQKSLEFRKVNDKDLIGHCKEGEALCPDGKCVPKCDGITDCDSGADEMNCPHTGTAVISPSEGVAGGGNNGIPVTIVDDCPSDEEFKCEISSMAPYDRPTQKIICAVQMCDGEKDCPNGDDEDKSICEPACTNHELACDGKCISLLKTCNQINDCSDGSDEDPKYCVEVCLLEKKTGDCRAFFPRWYFNSKVGKCEQFIYGGCDKNRNNFNTLETCTETCPIDDKGTHCKDDEFRCRDGSCIEDFKRCDYARDCPHNDDEEDCHRGCVPGQHQCGDLSCISIDLRCDGKGDCQDESDEKDCTCKAQEWQCKDGSCILASQRCDYMYQCTDHSDEDKCYGCQLGYWQCTGDHSCIADSVVCNGEVDCSDGSDELGCEGEHTCGDDEFSCHDDGTCIPKRLHCDGSPYCRDGSDELYCPTEAPPTCVLPDYFECNNGVCIKGDKKCDGINNCQDKSDEDDCPSATCSSDEFKCDDGRTCLSIDKTCDGRPDCPDGEDEKNCSPLKCPEDQFKCVDDEVCIPMSKHCDGIPDCPTTPLDEMNCMGPANCSSTEFSCNSGECVDHIKRCDNYSDCLDESDERGCSVKRPCTVDEFRCVKDGICINKAWRCDSLTDCLDESDEIGCSCTANQFKCGDGKCIESALQCDKQNDCSDGSDELDCGFCLVHDFVCDNGDCISHERRCDGTQDCQDGSDEEKCYVKPVCERYQFTCKNKDCIASHLKCDSKNDCIDGSDEIGCDDLPVPEGSTCSPVEFECGSGECISRVVLCDGRNDCLDNSDETTCAGSSNTTGGCGENEFTCIDGSCIDIKAKCDGISDCRDGADEINSDCLLYGHGGSPVCSENEFTCSDGHCIPLSLKCDIIADCIDGSDEFNCSKIPIEPIATTPPPPPPCHSTEFQCFSGECIPNVRHCDVYFDCPDQSDEHNCPTKKCDADEFTCGSGECISMDYHCNGKYECSDISDEDDCPVKCQPTEFKCHDGQCIDERRKCDSHFDCNDRSDEIDCRTDHFTCDDGSQTFVVSRRCDRIYDCRDGSDEQGCTAECTEDQFQCTSKDCIPIANYCDGAFDCIDRSDEGFNCEHPPDPYPGKTGGVNIRTYPEWQNVKQNQEVVFQCRDEGPLRKAVRWLWAGGPNLPPNAIDVKGRLTIPHIQVEHGGIYICEAQDVHLSFSDRTKNVTLNVVPYTPPPVVTGCSNTEATCHNGECILKENVCDGDADCQDGSDEERCANAAGCQPNEFLCNNQQCVGMAWLCDKDDDCGDGSDEGDCSLISSPVTQLGSNCSKAEFMCLAGNYCIPRSFHCDGETDCQMDQSDEIGCIKPIVIEPPPRTITVDIGLNFTIACLVRGNPMPIVIWRLNWGHVPSSCSMTSVDGYGLLTCVDAQVYHQGAYSCEAINVLGSVFAIPDAIVTVNSMEATCSPPRFNVAANVADECLTCFCFGITDQCHSSEKYVSQLPPPSDAFQIVGVNQDQMKGHFVIQDSKYLLPSNYLHMLFHLQGIQLEVSDRTQLGGPRDLLIYFSLPETHRGSQLTAYGGYLRYKIEFRSQFNNRRFHDNRRGSNQLLVGPDVIMRGNNMTLFHVHKSSLTVGVKNQIDIHFWPGEWYKRVTVSGGSIRTNDLATRREIMTVLENVELLLIRASYIDSDQIESTVYEIQLDTVVFDQNEQGRAVFVEECQCPAGYIGTSCQDCAPNARREYDANNFGRCVVDVSCPAGQYGDPAKNIPCLNCPCPLTNRENQFMSSCYLNTDGSVRCNCHAGYEGSRCEYCAEGYEGDPTVPGESCKLIAHECNAAGSVYSRVDPYTGACQCKDYTTGQYCDYCQEGTFNLHSNNEFGCLKCFCMGVSNTCTSSNWYRSQIEMKFTFALEGVKVVDEYQTNIRGTTLYVDQLNSELIFRPSLGRTEVLYWKLPAKFVGDKVHSYGGNLTYTLTYHSRDGDRVVKNDGYDVELFGNDMIVRYYTKETIKNGEQTTITVPLYEQYWVRQDGHEANREHFLMALANLTHIAIKATQATNTKEIALKEVTMSSATERNLGTERAFAVEKCSCSEEYRGLSCEECNIGYTRGLSGLYLGNCGLCECNGHSNQCDPETAVCFQCRNNRGGDRCELCAAGYYEQYGVCVRRIDSCTCDSRGSLSTECSGNRCHCKANVEGDQCNSCRDGSFYLSDHRDGCLDCWCNGVTTRCSSSQYYRDVLPMNLFENHGFTLSDRFRTNVVSKGLDVSIRENRISYTSFDKLLSNNTYYWSLPQLFTGNRLLSYGGKLSITQTFETKSDSDIYSDADIIISSAGNREFIWMNNNTLKPREMQNYTVNLIESEFLRDQRPARRDEFLAALASIEAILIRAQLSQNMVSSSLQYVTMDTASNIPSGKPKAYEVEQCNCPIQYVGFSCEQCAQGYYREIISKKCRRCPCNGKEESCVDQINGDVRCNCITGFTGPTCGMSDTGERPLVVLEIKITKPIYEVTVGATIELVCDVKTVRSIRPTITWDRREGQLPYGRAVDNRQGVLTITQVTKEDAGIYVCRASHLSTVKQSQTELVVRGIPPPRTKPVVIIEEKTEISSVIGHSFRIRCRATGNPSPHVQWTLSDGRTLSSRTSQRDGVLTFTNFQERDSGSYLCLATNHQGTSNATIIINVRRQEVNETFIIVQVTKEEIVAYPGESVRVTCSVPNTSFRATLTWTRVRKPMPAQSTQQNGILMIPNAGPGDSGLYICRATDNRLRFGETTTRITVQAATHRPVVRIEPDHQTINQGTAAELKCVVTGFPRPRIVWSMVNDELSNGVRITEDILRIDNAVISDRGRYLCTATNDVGQSRATAIIEVQRREPPVIEIYPESRQIVERGNSVMYQCHLTGGIPSPTIEWSRADGRPFTRNTENLRGGVLRFNNVTGAEEGSYICIAENDAGRVTATATLEIQASPAISIDPKTSPYIVKEGERVILDCQVTGDPTPTVVWQRVQYNYIHDLPASVLSSSRIAYYITNSKSSDQGTYQCNATNSIGSSIKRIQVIVNTDHPIQTVDNVYEVPVGGQFSFTCFVENITSHYVETYNYHFERSDGRPLPRTHTIIKGTFSVTNTTKEAAGEYACIVIERSTLRAISTIYATLEVTEPPRVRLEPERQMVRPGHNVSLYCIVTGARPITITWSKELGDMPSSVTINGGQLSFIGIATTDAGRYICEAINNIGRARGIAEVLVNESPLLVALREQITITEGEDAQLRCEATGLDPSIIQWSREGADRVPRNSNSSGHIFSIYNARQSDSGRYKCEARTYNGIYTYDHINLNVRKSTLLVAVREHITIPEGEDAQLVCEATGLDPNVIKWSREGARVPRDSAASGFVFNIYNVRPSDSGRYKCEATTYNGIVTYDHINLNVRSARVVDIRIHASTNDVRLGGFVDLDCDVLGDPSAVVAWSKLDGFLAYNAISRGSKLRINNVQPQNGGIYVCTSGNARKEYPLVIRYPRPVDPVTATPKTVRRSIQLGSPVVLECNVDLHFPNSYKWAKQNEKLPVRSRTDNDKLTIHNVQADDAGTYICTASNGQQSIDRAILLIVTGIVPSFSGESYLTMTALPKIIPQIYLEFDLEISFKPDDPNGLIIYNSQRTGRDDFISFGLKDGFAEFMFDVGSGEAVIKSKEPLAMGQWHTARLSRNRKDGTMIINDEAPVNGKSIGPYTGLELFEPLYIGGVPDISLLKKQTKFTSGFHGCISRFVIGTIVSDLIRDAKAEHQITPCDTCRINPCSNGGSCQEDYSPEGYKCSCPSGFAGNSCERAGESCYPGVCGSGRCVNTPDSVECFCPFGKIGTRCQHSIKIDEPAFGKGTYMAFVRPQAFRTFSITLNILPKSLDDGIIMYCGQRVSGNGDFTSLTIKDKRLEFKFDTGTGTATLYSDEIVPGVLIHVHVNRTDAMGSMQVDGGSLQNGNSPGDSRSLNLKTPFYIGGVNDTKITVAPTVGVSQSFIGCVSEIKIMEQVINIEKSVVESANVDQCGASPCSRNPCENEGTCSDDFKAHGGFVCQCPSGFSGHHCQIGERPCVQGKPCENSGVCNRLNEGENECLCPLSYTGDVCQQEYYLDDTVSFSKSSWVEVDRFLLPQGGITDQTASITFTTSESTGLLLWHGQERATHDLDKDYLTLSIVDGHLEFTFFMDNELVTAKSKDRVDDGKVHTVTIKRSRNIGLLQLDNKNPVISAGSESLFSFSTLGNIYLGGIPKQSSRNGFNGCFHGVTIGSTKISNFMDYVLKGVNVAPCSKGR